MFKDEVSAQLSTFATKFGAHELAMAVVHKEVATMQTKYDMELGIREIKNSVQAFARSLAEPIQSVSVELVRLEATVREQEADLAALRRSLGAVAPASSKIPQMPVHESVSSPPYPCNLIVDSADEAFLHGLPEDARYDVLNKRREELQKHQADRERSHVQASVPEQRTAGRVHFAENAAERPNRPRAWVLAAPFHECRSLEAAWLQLYQFGSKKGARWLLNVGTLKELSNREYAEISAAVSRMSRSSS